MLNVIEVKRYLGIIGETNDAQIEALIPTVLSFISKEIGKPVDAETIDEGLTFIASKLIEYFSKDAGLKSHSLSRESMTYSETIPSYLMAMLEPYKEVRPTNTGKITYITL